MLCFQVSVCPYIHLCTCLFIYMYLSIYIYSSVPRHILFFRLLEQNKEINTKVSLTTSLHHFFDLSFSGKSLNLRIRFTEKEDGLWFKETEEEKTDFEVRKVAVACGLRGLCVKGVIYTCDGVALFSA